jgi:hypothetical protein
MTAARDNDALTWGGESDPTHVDAPVDTTAADVAAPAAQPQTSSPLLIVYGIFAGVFLLYVIGWIIAIGGIGLPVAGVLPQVMYTLGKALAVAAPVLWFFGVLLLTRHAKTAVRVLWFVLGIAITAPWPFILGGVA